MAHDRFLPRNPIRLQSIVVARAVGRSVGWQGRALTLSRQWFFSDHFQTWQGHSLPEVLGRFRLWIIWWADQSWVHFFKVKTIKYGTNIALNMLFNKSSGFCYKCDFFLLIFSCVFQLRTLKSPLALSHAQFFSNYFQTRQGPLLSQNLGRVRLLRFCLIRYAHYGPINMSRSILAFPGVSF